MLVILKHVRCLNVMLLHFGLAIMGKVFLAIRTFIPIQPRIIFSKFPLLLMFRFLLTLYA